MDIRVNNFYLDSQLEVLKTPQLILSVGVLATLLALIMITTPQLHLISQNTALCIGGAGLLTIALSQVKRDKTLLIIASSALIISAIATALLFTRNLPFSPEISLATLSISLLSLMMMSKRRGVITIALVTALICFLTFALPPPVGKPLMYLSGGISALSALLLAMQRKLSKEEMIASLRANEVIEIDHPETHASLHAWLEKQNITLTGKKIRYSQTLCFPLKPPISNRGKEISFELITNRNDPRLDDVAEGFAHSFGYSIEKAKIQLQLNLYYQENLLMIKSGDKVIGGSFYRILPQEIYIHSLCRKAHEVGGNIIKHLMAHLHAAIAQGKRLSLDVFEDNPARTLYKKAGFYEPSCLPSFQFNFGELRCFSKMVTS